MICVCSIMNMINICMVHVSMIAAYTDTRDTNTNIALQVTSLCVILRELSAASYWSKRALTCVYVCVCVCVCTYVRVCVSVRRIWFILRIVLILLTKRLTIYLNTSYVRYKTYIQKQGIALLSCSCMSHPAGRRTAAVSVGQSGEPHYPLSYGVPVRERYGSTLLPATREQHDQNCTQSH